MVPYIFFGCKNQQLFAQAKNTVALDTIANGIKISDISFIATCDSTEQRYAMILPTYFKNDKPHDMLIALHGHGADRWQFIYDTRGECRAARDVATTHNMIYVSPDYRAKTSWMGPKAESDVKQIINIMKNQYRIRRIFLCGGSMGGTASLIFATLHPNLIDGVASMNGTANLLEYANFQDAIAESYGGNKSTVPNEYKKRSAELNKEKLTMAIGFSTGGKDDIVPPQSILRLADALKKNNQNVLIIHRPETGHQTNYEDAKAIIEFIIQRTKFNHR